MTLDVAAILTTLRRHDVECVVVGGVAARAHGASQAPADVDVVLEASWRNFERAADALQALNARPADLALPPDVLARLPPIEINAAYLAQATITTWDTDHGGLDLLDSILDRQGHPLYYERLIDHAVPRQLNSTAVLVASLSDVIESKAAANRPQDLATVAELQRIAPVRTTENPPPPLQRPPGRDFGLGF